MTDARDGAAYLGGKQREVKDINDMLQHQEYLSHEVERRQAESRRWARAGMLGRLAEGVRDQADQHPGRSRLIAITTPMAVVLGLLGIII